MLRSTLFADNEQLKACAVSDPAHLTRGVRGEHVSRVQSALFAIDKLAIDGAELRESHYGASTAAAVLSYKRARKIINPSYQKTEDDIVGKMTIASLDKDLLALQGERKPGISYCMCDRRNRTLSMVTRTQSGFMPVAAPVGGPTGKSPAELAFERVADVKAVIAATIVVLTRLIEFRIVSVPRVPPSIAEEFDKVWRTFGIPKNMPFSTMDEFPPITNLTDFLSAIRSVYQRMDRDLGKGPGLFRTMPQSLLGEAHGWTLVDTRVAGDPPATEFPNGIYFGDKFAKSTRPKMVEVIVHELAHFKAEHNFNDDFKPDSENWGKFDGNQGILNAWSYNMFMLDAVFNIRQPL